MTEKQRSWFKVAYKQLDKKSKFYEQDLDSLLEHIHSMTDSECDDAIDRFNSSSSVTDSEIRRNCQV